MTGNMYMHNWITLLYIWNEYNIVNQLYSNIKIKSLSQKGVFMREFLCRVITLVQVGSFPWLKDWVYKGWRGGHNLMLWVSLPGHLQSHCGKRATWPWAGSLEAGLLWSLETRSVWQMESHWWDWHPPGRVQALPVVLACVDREPLTSPLHPHPHSALPKVTVKSLMVPPRG